jgi:hypothetical protein
VNGGSMKMQSAGAAGAFGAANDSFAASSILRI